MTFFLEPDTTDAFARTGGAVFDRDRFVVRKWLVDFRLVFAAGFAATVRRAREEPAGFFLGDDFFGFIGIAREMTRGRCRGEIMAASDKVQR